ncbi:MAG: hypothetical protein CMK06_00765 [Ponticaulis sp.]|nr:hypothetical protein [Ponticaulis sp.]|tara:strand:- start:813 stop:1208 length:396 start_codon:yes stop_codon:yes gene_type:complete
MRSVMGILALATACALPGWATEDSIDDRFDGQYRAVTELADYWDNAEECRAGMEFDVVLEDGNFSSQPAGLAKGIMTSDGYFKGEFALADKKLVDFEGIVEGNQIIGSALAPDESCAWQVTLTEQFDDKAY